MYELKKFGKPLSGKSVGTGPSSCEKKNLPARGLTNVEKYCSKSLQPRTCICFPYSQVVFCSSVIGHLWGFLDINDFTVWGRSHAQPPTSRTRVPLFWLSHHLWPAQHERLCHVALRIPPLRQSRYTIGGVCTFWRRGKSSRPAWFRAQDRTLWCSRCTERELQCHVCFELGLRPPVHWIEEVTQARVTTARSRKLTLHVSGYR
jgi:hypothetical protein